MNIICKFIRQKLRAYNKEKQEKMIQDILETTKSTNKINKNKAIGENWTAYIEDPKGEKVCEREKINKSNYPILSKIV